MARKIAKTTSAKPGRGAKEATAKKAPAPQSKEQVLATMNAAAEVAKKEFNALPPKDRKVIAEFYKAHYLKAGYKRIGKILVAASKADGYKAGYVQFSRDKN